MTFDKDNEGKRLLEVYAIKEKQLAGQKDITKK